MNRNDLFCGMAAIAAPVFALAMTGTASAASADFNIYNNNSTGAAFSLNVTQGSGNAVDFTFVNVGGSGSGFVNAIQTVDFEQGFGSMLSDNASFSYSDSSMSFISAKKKNPYDAHKLDWQGTFFRAQSTSQAAAPVDAGDFVTVSFDLLDGISFDDLVASLGNPGYQIATHTKGINVATVLGDVIYGESSGGQQADVVVPVHAPTPSAIGAGLMILGGLALRRKRTA